MVTLLFTWGLIVLYKLVEYSCSSSVFSLLDLESTWLVLEHWLDTWDKLFGEFSSSHLELETWTWNLDLYMLDYMLVIFKGITKEQTTNEMLVFISVPETMKLKPEWTRTRCQLPQISQIQSLSWPWTCQGTPSKPYPHHEVRQFRLRSCYSSIYSPTPTIYPLRQDIVIALLTKPSRRRDRTLPRLLPYREIPLLLYFSIVLLFHCL